MRDGIAVEVKEHVTGPFKYVLRVGNIQLKISIYPDTDNGDPIHMWWDTVDNDALEGAMRGLQTINAQIAILERARNLLIYGI